MSTITVSFWLSIFVVCCFYGAVLHPYLTTNDTKNLQPQPSKLLQHRRSLQMNISNDAIVADVVPDADSLCEIDLIDDSTTVDNVNTTRVNANVDFWYAVGTINNTAKTKSTLDDRVLFLLNQVVYTSMRETNVWCTPIQNDTNTVTRNLKHSSVPRLGVVTFIPGDTHPSSDCTLRITNFILY
jgi:hypothetical protein